MNSEYCSFATYSDRKTTSKTGVGDGEAPVEVTIARMVNCSMATCEVKRRQVTGVGNTLEIAEAEAGRAEMVVVLGKCAKINRDNPQP